MNKHLIDICKLKKLSKILYSMESNAVRNILEDMAFLRLNIIKQKKKQIRRGRSRIYRRKNTYESLKREILILKMEEAYKRKEGNKLIKEKITGLCSVLSFHLQRISALS